MNVVLIDYNAGNVQSVLYALQRLGIHAEVSANHGVIRRADKVIFPGVGSAGSAMEYLRAHGLDTLITSLTQPVLGICLGLQLLCRHSEEADTQCLGVFDVQVKRFHAGEVMPHDERLKIPHMGWNTITNLRSPLFAGIPEDSYVYNVHSYYAERSDDTIAVTDYFLLYSAALQYNNFYGVQFHVEKSAKVGEKILSNFIKM